MNRGWAIALLVLAAATNAGAGDRAELANVTTEWQNAYGIIIYTVLADVKNVSPAPLQFVKIRVVLTDKSGATVAERDGYNMGAEALADATTPATIEEKLLGVTPIPPGGTDHFRLSLDKSDIGKPFRATHVAVVEVR